MKITFHDNDSYDSFILNIKPIRYTIKRFAKKRASLCIFLQYSFFSLLYIAKRFKNAHKQYILSIIICTFATKKGKSGK